FRAVAWKELRICAGMAGVLSAVVFVEGLILGIFEPESSRVLLASLAIALAMVAHVVGAGLFGVMVPLAAKAAGRDPATVSTPAVTAIADLSGATMFCAVVLAAFHLAGGAD